MDSQGQAIGSRKLGEALGAWTRIGLHDDRVLVAYRAKYSSGVFISDKLWRREKDHVGIGYGCMDGAEQTQESLSNSQVAEG